MSANFLLFLSAFLFGIWGLANKLAVNHAHPLTVQWMYSLPQLFILPLTFMITNRVSPQTTINKGALGWAILANLAGVAATLAVFFALRTTSASYATAITAAYPVFSLILAVMIGSETFSVMRLLGVVAIIIGVILLQSAR